MNRIPSDILDRNIAVLSGKIEVLQQQETQLRTLLDSVTQDRLNLQAQRDELETQRYPIHWLPPELLISIFVLATDTYDPALHLDEMPIRLSHVCRKWRAVAISTPILWRRIFLNPRDLMQNRPPGDATSAFLVRSKDIPIEAIYTNRVLDDTPRPAEPSSRGQNKSVTHELAFPTLPPLKSIFGHAEHDIMDYVLRLIRNENTEFPHLEFIDLALTNGTSTKLFDALRFDLSAVVRNPWELKRFPELHSITLQDVSLGCLPMGQMPALRELSMKVTPWAPAGPYRDEFLRVIYLARFLACAPNIEHLAFARAGPVFHLKVDPDMHPDYWASKAAWNARGRESIPPVPLLRLRELDWTGAHPDSLYYFFTHFPVPALEVLDIGLVDLNKNNVPVHGPDPMTIASLSTAPPDQVVLQPVLELTYLKVLRVECTSGDVLRTPFLKLCFPALETLFLSNLDLSLRWAGAGSNTFSALPYLPRSESMFRDPRMPHLTHFLLSAFTVLAEHAPTMLAYMPALERLECDVVDGVSELLAALAAPRTARVGLPKCCPRLRAVHLWCCDAVDFAALERAVKLRNGFWTPAPDAPLLAETAINGRVIRPLRKTARALDSPAARTAKAEETCAKIAEVHVEGCPGISEEQAMSLEKWGVDVVWFPPEEREEV